MKKSCRLVTALSMMALCATHVLAQDGFSQSLPLQKSRLESARGGFEIVQNDLQLRGMVAQNQASHIQSGNNVIADGAFSNASGMPMVVQNSGSNVLIQNATIVNVQFQ
jgi:hypothetical protein